MKVDKMSVSFDADLGQSIRTSARRAGSGLSGWLADAAAEKLRREAFDEFLHAWETEHGPITGDEFARARERLGLAASSAE
jgi:hypothetical protein